MKNEELDKVFKKGADDPLNEPAYRQADWDAMEQLLSQDRRRGIVVYWLPRLGSVAAVLALAVLAWMFFRPQPAKTNSANVIATVHSKPDTGISGGAGRHEMADSSKQKNNPANLAQNSAHPGAGKKTDRSFPYQPDGHAAKMPGKSPANVFAQNSADDTKKFLRDRKEIGTADFTPKNNNELAASNAAEPGNKKDIGTADAKKSDLNSKAIIANNTAVPGDKKDIGTGDAKKNNADSNALMANNAAAPGDRKDIGTGDAKKNNADSNALIANNATMPGDKKDIGTGDNHKNDGDANSTAATTSKLKVKAGSTSAGANRAVFAITAIASSDVNGSSPLSGGSLGGNLGALFSVSSGKWTLSSGGMYSIKPYQESFADYHTPYNFQAQPTSVGANCRMIDIPLDVNYQVYHKGINKFTVGTGLSSYIILREDYTFNYAGSYYAYGPSGYSVVNRNRNIMSILNLDVTYERQINSRFGLVLQPYYKMPLTNVGASQVKLQSTGIAVGLNWNLNTFKKPK